MTKVSIVGVEGSGKTVLMAVLGDKYKLPDANGLSLKPNNFTTMSFVETAVADLHNGAWPAATPPEEMKEICWTLQQKTEEGTEAICELPMLDFAGEVYRLAFGEHAEEEIKPYAEAVTALREHVASSSCLIVLVNLSHVINGSMKDVRTQETIWLTQRIVDFAKEHGIASIAIGLSQIDRYRDEIAACGGVRQAICRYLPYLGASDSSLDVLELSAVDGVRPTAAGQVAPVADYGSQGLQELVTYIAKAREKGRGEAMICWRGENTRNIPLSALVRFPEDGYRIRFRWSITWAVLFPFLSFVGGIYLSVFFAWLLTSHVSGFVMLILMPFMILGLLLGMIWLGFRRTRRALTFYLNGDWYCGWRGLLFAFGNDPMMLHCRALLKICADSADPVCVKYRSMRMIHGGHAVQNNAIKAQRLLRMAVKRGNAESLAVLGWMRANSLGHWKSWDNDAERFWTEALSAGSVLAALFLGKDVDKKISGKQAPEIISESWLENKITLLWHFVQERIRRFQGGE